jgi:2-polyprenyl-3-methyl-5-hydroxy-6-metoxy-1,4-benzoquinol methylase
MMRILISPATKEGEGSGHLRRSLALLQALGGDARLLYEQADGGERDALLAALGLAPGSPRLQRRLGENDAWDLIVLDRRATPPAEVRRLFERGCIVGLDEGGSRRDCLPYLIDTLPGIDFRHAPNVRSFQLPAYPQARRECQDPVIRSVLVSFGGEDPAHLSERLLALLLKGSAYGFSEVTVVEGPLFGPRTWPDAVKVLRRPPRLVDRLSAYDLVFCSYGLTCFEALAAGAAVILLNPTRRHRRLSRRQGLPEIGVKTPRPAKLRRLLAQPERLSGLPGRAAGLDAAPPGESLPALLSGLDSPARSGCPLCGGGPSPAVARFPRRTYVRCRGCGLVYLLSFSPKRQDYEGEYFFNEYRRQYGRTYLEDFGAIKQRAAGRLALIGRWIGGGPKGRRLLDVGCAYGAFQQAAHETGYQTLGVERGRESSRYVREQLGLECLTADFETQATPGSFDVVSMWFVIEHFQRLDGVLEKTAALLKPGGIFAFSTPNGSGISARKNRKKFLRSSPQDHYSLWFPSRVRKQLKRFGFRVLATKVTGHHPERFPLPAGLKGKAGPFLAALSRIFRLGDTFEVYALKTKQPGRTNGGRHSS